MSSDGCAECGASPAPFIEDDEHYCGDCIGDVREKTESAGGDRGSTTAHTDYPAEDS